MMEVACPVSWGCQKKYYGTRPPGSLAKIFFPGLQLAKKCGTLRPEFDLEYRLGLPGGLILEYDNKRLEPLRRDGYFLQDHWATG